MKFSQMTKPMMACIAILVGISCIATAAVISAPMTVNNTVVATAGIVTFEAMDTTAMGGDHTNLPNDLAQNLIIGQEYDAGIKLVGSASANVVVKYNIMKDGVACVAGDVTLKYYDGDSWESLVAPAGTFGPSTGFTITSAYTATTPILVIFNTAGIYATSVWVENA